MTHKAGFYDFLTFCLAMFAFCDFEFIQLINLWIHKSGKYCCVAIKHSWLCLFFFYHFGCLSICSSEGNPVIAVGDPPPASCAARGHCRRSQSGALSSRSQTYHIHLCTHCLPSETAETYPLTLQWWCIWVCMLDYTFLFLFSFLPFLFFFTFPHSQTNLVTLSVTRKSEYHLTIPSLCSLDNWN